MNVQPYGERKTELLWLFHPESGAVIDFAPEEPWESFAARVVLPRCHTDLMIYDDRTPRPVQWLYGRPQPPTFSWVAQHQYRVRTTPHRISTEDFAALRDREYILDVLHPYFFQETERIVQAAARGEPYSATLFSEPAVVPRRPHPKKRNRYRDSAGWQVHSGVTRDALVSALRQGAEDIAQVIYDTIGPRVRETGYISPPEYTTPWLNRERRLRG